MLHTVINGKSRREITSTSHVRGFRERKFTFAIAEKYCARWASIHYGLTPRAEFYSVQENASLEYAVESRKRR
jgi:hypothetical protein